MNKNVMKERWKRLEEVTRPLDSDGIILTYVISALSHEAFDNLIFELTLDRNRRAKHDRD